MPIGDRYELLDGQRFLAQDVINAYFYKATAGPSPSAGDLVTQWIFYVLPKILPLQSTLLVHQIIAARNLDNPLDFFATPLIAGNVGTSGGQAMPPFVAWAFRLLRTRTDVHHGAKRIAGITENQQVDGVVEPAFQTTVDDFASFYGSILPNVNGNLYAPVIMRRVLDENKHLIGYDDFPAGLGQYVRISTQNTRKFGRGA